MIHKNKCCKTIWQGHIAGKFIKFNYSRGSEPNGERHVYVISTSDNYSKTYDFDQMEFRNFTIEHTSNIQEIAGCYATTVPKDVGEKMLDWFQSDKFICHTLEDPESDNVTILAYKAEVAPYSFDVDGGPDGVSIKLKHSSGSLIKIEFKPDGKIMVDGSNYDVPDLANALNRFVHVLDRTTDWQSKF